MDRAAAIEWTMDAVPALLFGGAISYAALALSLQMPIAVGGVAAAFAYLCLRAVPGGRGPRRVRSFESAPLQFDELSAEQELLLGPTDEFRPERDAKPKPDPAAAELLLDEVEAALVAHSTVIRLFEPWQSPIPGDVQRSIDRHLRDRQFRNASPDASHELSLALAELRRSLR